CALPISTRAAVVAGVDAGAADAIDDAAGNVAAAIDRLAAARGVRGARRVGRAWSLAAAGLIAAVDGAAAPCVVAPDASLVRLVLTGSRRTLHAVPMHRHRIPAVAVITIDVAAIGSAVDRVGRAALD